MSKLDPVPILGPDGAIARRLASYEARPQQIEMAEAVARAIETRRHLMVEAGTGVGKSFAYLVPAIQAAAEPKKKVVVSTHTISLQEQLLQKDLPFLRAVMPQEFSAVLVKGRSNYISLRRLDARRRLGRGDVPEARGVRPARRGPALGAAGPATAAGPTSTSARCRPSGTPSPARTATALARTALAYKDCFYFKARRRMWSANILVVNHALFMSDLASARPGRACSPITTSPSSTRPTPSKAVAGEHLGLRVTSGQVEYLLTRLYNDRTNKGLLVYPPARRGHAARSSRSGSRPATSSTTSPTGRRGRGRPTAGSASRSGWPDTLGEELRKLATSIGEGADGVEEEEQRIELVAAAGPLRRPGRFARQLARPGDRRRASTGSRSRGQPRRRVTLACAPLDVGPTLRRDLFDRVPTCILTSATLCVGSPPRFDFPKARLGLTACESLQLGSPFDYPKQVTIHLPRNLPDPSDAVGRFRAGGDPGDPALPRQDQRQGVRPVHVVPDARGRRPRR